jgi:hypothetical protein
MTNKDYLYIFLHLPKTGGSTFSQHIIDNMRKEEFTQTSETRYNLSQPNKDKDKIRIILGHATYYGIHNLFPGKIPRYILFLRDPAERFISSYNFEMRTKEGKNADFWEWYKSQVKNEITHFLNMKYEGKPGAKANLPKGTLSFFAKIFKSKTVYLFFQKIYEKYIKLFKSSEKIQRAKLENAKKLLNKCWYIGFIPDLNKDLKFLFKEIGVPVKWKNENVTGKKENFFKLDDETRKKIYEDNKYDLELYNYAKDPRG